MSTSSFNNSSTTPHNSTNHSFRNDYFKSEEQENNTGSSIPPPPSKVPNQNQPSPSSSSSSSKNELVGAAIGVGVVFILLLIIFYILRGRKLGKKQNSLFPSGGNFAFGDLEASTNGFSASNLIGEGGFGFVYRGVLPPHQKELAIKRLKPGSAQGEHEFNTEVDLSTRVHHRHLTTPLGFCIHGDERLLVYQFVPNHNLRYHLHRENGCTIDWPTRMKIAVGVARGLAYLHTECSPYIIHRDIKSSNVLIDENFEAQLCDFGLAKVNTDNHSYLSTAVKGTFGYLDPGYHQTKKLSVTSDVYSFGVLLLELITGKGPLDPINETGIDKSLIDWARPLLDHGLEEGGSFVQLVDPNLGGNYNCNQIKRMAICVLSCINKSSTKRPNMTRVVRALEQDLYGEDLEDLKKEMIKSSDKLQHLAEILNFKRLLMSSNGNEPSVVYEV